MQAKKKRIAMFKNFKKIILALLIAGMNANGLSAVFGTYSYFSDTQISSENFFHASNLDFSLVSPADFSPKVYPNSATSSRSISLQNDGLLGFNYEVKSNNASGTLCDFLNLKATLRGIQVYDGALKSFDFSAGEFAASTTNWQFIASMTSTDTVLQDQTCQFNFVFNGTQLEGAGFYNEETIANTITSSQWQKVVINKVYYDVCDKADGSCGEYKGEEDKNEWIELYNPTNAAVDLQGWTIYNHNDHATIHNKLEIPALGYAILTHDATTEKYWEIPTNVSVSYQLGGQFIMDNDNDMLVLKDGNEAVVDQMNWGTPDPAWDNYSDNLWNPGVVDADEGFMIGRVPAGFDTDQVTDWQSLGLPQVKVIRPNGGEKFYLKTHEDLKWEALNLNGLTSDLSFDIWYSNDKGKTWGRIVSNASTTENNGVFTYDWYVLPFVGDDGNYNTISSKARIKVIAYGPENFMVQGSDASDNNFCPPIDMSVLTQEEIDKLIAMDIIDINGNVLGEEEDGNGGNGEITGQNEEEAPVETEPAINEPAIEEEPIVEPEVAPEQNEISEPAIINEGETAGGEGEASPETTPPSNPPPENNNVEISQQTAGE